MITLILFPYKIWIYLNYGKRFFKKFFLLIITSIHWGKMFSQVYQLNNLFSLTLLNSSHSSNFFFFLLFQSPWSLPAVSKITPTTPSAINEHKSGSYSNNEVGKHVSLYPVKTHGHLTTLTQMQTHSPPRTSWSWTPEVGPVSSYQICYWPREDLGSSWLFIAVASPSVLPIGETPSRKKAKQRWFLLLDKGNFSPFLSPLLTERCFGHWLIWNHFVNSLCLHHLHTEN